ncbi:DNA cytosine methyltransferase [Halosimplex rubrum]|uniref:DNA (cytosine-5-)-methyltransferase n=1 Tax=Halosimplex rubrum TaxID=869889 RepID=A0A7D5P399_9EURY|nr:DNA cytosine methyltransferase [Halosimplex rubrum]QLH79863.1 DNA cytosine methyltransferase [Halosimplex rubrum]
MERSTLSLFAGAGGCTLGFDRAGFDVKLGIDIDSDAISTYDANFSEIDSVQKDLSNATSDWLLERLELEPGELDFLIGGPPCQGFSSAGNGFWDDPRNQLLKQYIRYLEELQPKWFLMENVEGLLTAQESQYITETARKLVDAGYTIRVHKLYSHWHGLPQKRKRVFIVGNSGGVNFEFPDPTHHGISAVSPPRSITDAISDLPEPAESKPKRLEYASTPETGYQQSLRNEAVTDHYDTEVSDVLRKRIEHLESGQSMQDLPEDLQHDSFDRRASRRVKDGTPTEKRGGAPSGLKRLVPDEPSLTITGGSRSEFVHPERDRFLTLRECARIQSFPDWFQFRGSKTSKQQQIANAIPPLIAEKLADHFGKVMERNADAPYGDAEGGLLGFFMTKADSRSPALDRTHDKLSELRNRTQVEV